MTALITPEQLLKQLNHENVKIFDASFPMSSAHPMAIPGSLRFDIDEIAHQGTAMAHMLPSAEEFEEHMQALGITNDDLIIVYDQKGLALAAARVWWMFRVFGHNNVKILDGGLPEWLAADYPVEPFIPTKTAPSQFKATFKPELVKSMEDVLKNTETQEFSLVDARSPERFKLSGHIPNSQNAFFMELLDPATGCLKSKENLKACFNHLNIETDTSITTSCGSGITACVSALALFELGYKNVSVYDGSWSEWSSNRKNPIVKS